VPLGGDQQGDTGKVDPARAHAAPLVGVLAGSGVFGLAVRLSAGTRHIGACSVMDLSKIAQITDEKALRNLMGNARRLGREDAYWLAFRRLCALEGMRLDDPLERDFYDVLNAYEELLTEKNGRTTKANRTRQKLRNKGLKQCLIDWALGPPTDGFKLLIEKGLAELTAEHLVVKYESRFPSPVVAAARARLHDAGTLKTES